MEKSPKKRSKNGGNKSPSKKAKTAPTAAASSAPKGPVTNGNIILDWDKFDIDMLLHKIEDALPKSDHLKFSTGVEKLDWDKVAFKNYSDKECKEKWLEIQGRLRRFRTLTDMVTDAKAWTKTPWITHTAYKRTKHPDMPKKPLTPFFRYFVEKRAKMERDKKIDPTVSVTDLAKVLSVKFSEMDEKKKKKYKKAYEKEYGEYKVKMEQFKDSHPELVVERKVASRKEGGVAKEPEGPVKPKTPFQLYLEKKLEELEEAWLIEEEKRVPKEGEKSREFDKKATVEFLKNEWPGLKLTKRMKWIRRAFADEARYIQELHEYKEQNPSFEIPTVRSVLNKAEKAMMDKFDGKPDKPPGSGYSLFSQTMLRNLKENPMPSKEKMICIAKRWNELSPEEKVAYNNDAQIQMARYAEKFEAWLQKLPESERAKAAAESKVRLPSVKKLKQLGQNRQAQLDNRTVEELDQDSNVKTSAFNLFQQERVNELQSKYQSEKTISEILDMVFKEWTKMKVSKKGKWLKKAATACPPPVKTATIVPTTPSPTKKGKKAASPNKVSSGTSAAQPSDESRRREVLTQVLKRAPDTPRAKSGYALFTADTMPKLTNIGTKDRMKEVSMRWKALSADQQKKYIDKVSDARNKYNDALVKFKKTLSSEELILFEDYLKNPKASGLGKSNKSKGTNSSEPVLDDDNVYNEVVIETTNHEEEDSDDDSDEDDDDSDEESEDEEPPPVSRTVPPKEESSSEEEDDDDDSDDDDDDDSD